MLDKERNKIKVSKFRCFRESIFKTNYSLE